MRVSFILSVMAPEWIARYREELIETESQCQHFPLFAEVMAFEQTQRGAASLRDLVHRALPGRLIRTPPNQARAMSKSAASEMVVTNLDHELRLKWFPFGRAFGAPATRTARRLARESGRLDQGLEFLE